jgi:DNA-binding PadR family transcriptional regulator
MVGEDMKFEDELLKLLYEARQNTVDGFISEEKLAEHFKLPTAYIQPYIHTLQEDEMVEVERVSLRNRSFCRYKLTSKGKKLLEVKKIEQTVSTQPGVTNVPFGNKYEDAVFVSYAWGGESERTVDELEKAFAKRNIYIVRDKKELGYKGSIEEFEQRIGRGQCIIIVISDKYLRSEHCMYELVEIEENRELRKRIFPIVLGDAHIYKAVNRLDYIQHWEEQIEQLNQAIKQVNRLTNLAGITTDLDKYARIRSKFDHLTDLLSNMNALTPEIHTVSGFSTLINAVESALAEKLPKY